MPAPTAKEVARELDRRHSRRRVGVAAALAAAIALAVSYLTCGDGFGLGGKGAGRGAGPGAATPIDAGPAHCAIRISATGTTVDGEPAATPAAVIDRCRSRAPAAVTVTGDARQGDWDALRSALEAAGVRYDLVR